MVSFVVQALFLVGFAAFVLGLTGAVWGGFPIESAPIGVLLMLPRLYSELRAGVVDSESDYPSYDPAFIHNLTWECTNCGQTIYWQEGDSTLICHKCNTSYSLTRDEFPELLRAKCWNCGKVSESVGGFRAENIRFDCPHCEFEWESDPY